MTTEGRRLTIVNPPVHCSLCFRQVAMAQTVQGHRWTKYVKTQHFTKHSGITENTTTQQKTPMTFQKTQQTFQITERVRTTLLHSLGRTWQLNFNSCFYLAVSLHDFLNRVEKNRGLNCVNRRLFWGHTSHSWYTLQPSCWDPTQTSPSEPWKHSWRRQTQGLIWASSQNQTFWFVKYWKQVINCIKASRNKIKCLKYIILHFDMKWCCVFCQVMFSQMSMCFDLQGLTKLQSLHHHKQPQHINYLWTNCSHSHSLTM